MTPVPNTDAEYTAWLGTLSPDARDAAHTAGAYAARVQARNLTLLLAQIDVLEARVNLLNQQLATVRAALDGLRGMNTMVAPPLGGGIW